MRVQLVGVNVPVLLVAKETVPVGVEGLVVDLSTTLAVQVTAPLTITDPGMQLMVVCVGFAPDTVVTVTVTLFEAVFAFPSVAVTDTVNVPAVLNVVVKLVPVPDDGLPPVAVQANV
jgi:hypothetical protein